MKLTIYIVVSLSIILFFSCRNSPENEVTEQESVVEDSNSKESSTSSTDSLKIVTGEWPPYVSHYEKGGGLTTILLKEAFAEQGIEIKYEFLPWTRGYSEAKSLVYDRTYPYAKTEEREADFFYSEETLIVAKSVFFHFKSTDFDWKTLDDLRDYRVGGTTDNHDSIFLDDNGIELDWVNEEHLNFTKLLYNRIDVYGGTFTVGYSWIYKNFEPEQTALFTNHPKPYKTGENFFLVSKEHPDAEEIIKNFDAGMRKLKQSGKYDLILNSFYME
jgi:polar amino acid transport system substrate-binding protein